MRRLSAAVLAVVLVTTACGESTKGSGSRAEAPGTLPATPPATATQTPSTSLTDPGAAAKMDPCSLVTQQEADAIAGTHLMPKVRAEQLCTFPTPTTGTTAQLEVYVGDGAQKYYEIDHTNLGHKFTDVPGVGDEAHLEDGAIFFRAKGTWAGLRLLRLDSVDTGPSLIQLAKLVAGRLG